MTWSLELSRAYVNNGGDIALHLAPGEKFVVGIVERPDRASLFGTTTIAASDPARHRNQRQARPQLFFGNR